MTGEEQSVVQAIENYRNLTFAASLKIAEARAKLYSVGCSHPKKYIVNYPWEHTSLQGKKQLLGEKCRICLAVRPQKGVGSWTRINEKV